MKRERNWEALYNTGGIALIAMAGIIIIQMFVFMAATPLTKALPNSESG